MPDEIVGTILLLIVVEANALFDSFNRQNFEICPLVIGDVCSCWKGGLRFSSQLMSTLPTADLLALDTDGIESRLSKLRRYL